MNIRSRSFGVAVVGLALAAAMPLRAALADGPSPGNGPPSKDKELPLTTPVRVTNGDENPIPVAGSVEIDGTADVNVTNAPDVHVANEPGVHVANQPNVNVANRPEVVVGNTPDVNIANMPGVQVEGPVALSGPVDATQSGEWTVGFDPGGNTVQVANSSSDPLLVRDVDGGALDPFAAEMTGAVDLCTTVPDGKRLVVEWVSWAAYQDAGDTVHVRPAIRAVTSGNSVRHPLSFTTLVSPVPGSTPDRQWYTASHATKIYADGGSDVCVQGVAISGALHSQTASVSGYLVDA